jgi:antitoxin MazE
MGATLPLLRGWRGRIFNVETAPKDPQMRVTRWGNSLAVRIPKALAEQTRIEEGSEVELSVSEGALVIRPRGPSFSLEELLARVTPENRHDEVDWGEPQGNEVW